MDENEEPKKTVFEHMFGWQVVSIVSVLLLGAGASIMTAPHPYIADSFFFVGFSLLLIKFWTWEEAKYGTTRKTALLLAGVTVFTLVLFAGSCWLSYYLNSPKQVVAVQTPPASPLTNNSVVPVKAPAEPVKRTAAPITPRKHTPQVAPPTTTSPAAALSPPATNTQTCIGSACAQGQGAQATFNQFGATPRKLPDPIGMSSCLSSVKGKVMMTAAMNDGESDAYGNQLMTVFKNAGWEAPEGMGWSMTIDNETHQIYRGVSFVFRGTLDVNKMFNSDDPVARNFVKCAFQWHLPDKHNVLEANPNAPIGVVAVHAGLDSRQ